MAVGLRKRRRIQLVVIGALLLAVATALVGYAMRDGIEFFRSPSQLAEHPARDGERFRLGGLVEKGSVVREAGEVRFVVTDGGDAGTMSLDDFVAVALRANAARSRELTTEVKDR